MAEKYQLVVNYEGVDMLIEVDDLETASVLLNDPIAAQHYVEQLIEMEELAAATEPSTEPSTRPSAEPSTEQHQEQEQTEPVIWSTKRTTKCDQEATILLLELRKKYSKEFGDKTTRKGKLWADIAKAIIQKGLNLGDTPAEKCRQKFTNLQKAYTRYIMNQKTTGTEKMEIPPFFDELNEILGEQHKVNPVSLMDTEEDVLLPSTSTNEINTNSQPSCSLATPTGKQTLPIGESESDIENRFSRSTKRQFKKKSKTNDLIQEIQVDREKRCEQFEFFKKHLKKTEQQRDKLINIFETSLKGVNKRKRKDSSSDSD